MEVGKVNIIYLMRHKRRDLLGCPWSASAPPYSGISWAFKSRYWIIPAAGPQRDDLAVDLSDEDGGGALNQRDLVAMGAEERHLPSFAEEGFDEAGDREEECGNEDGELGEDDDQQAEKRQSPKGAVDNEDA